MADNFNLRQYLVENKLGPFAKAKSINENSRIEGLVNQDMLRKFLITTSNIVEDLEAEGFDEEDILDYLSSLLDNLSLNMLRARIPARKGTEFGSQSRSPLQEDEHNYPDDAPGRVQGDHYDGMMLNAGKPGEYMEYTVKGQSANLNMPPVKFTLADIPNKNIININGELKLNRSALEKIYNDHGQVSVTVKGSSIKLPDGLAAKLFGSKKAM